MMIWTRPRMCRGYLLMYNPKIAPCGNEKEAIAVYMPTSKRVSLNETSAPKERLMVTVTATKESVLLYR